MQIFADQVPYDAHTVMDGKSLALEKGDRESYKIGHGAYVPW